MRESTPVLSASKRERLGTRYSQRERDQGRLPIVVYSKGTEPLSLSVDARETKRHINKGEKIFRMDLAGVFDKQTVLLKDVQFDYLGTEIVHADFARVSLTDRIRARVPIHLVGEAPGLKQAGAILMHPTNEVVVECVVTDLPEYIEVSLGTLDVGHAITAGEVTLPGKGMKMITDKHAILAQVIIQQEIVVGEATAAEGGPAEPEVITAKKVEGEEGAAAPGDKKAGAPAAKGAAPAAKDAKPAGGDKKK
ncbi:MAG: 50S ribosomal protein L25 [Phycisphaerales bacterium]|jgi:large subunit ribosomal protein L25|nr:50S ribosomal protein L25 [Phycisphaerales bacterium]